MTELFAPGTPALYAFDMSAWVHRYLHAGAPSAGLAFADLVKRVVRDRGPRYVAVAEDASPKTWRHDVFPAYKAGRKRSPEEQAALDKQFARARDELYSLGACVLGASGFEADDVLCSVAEKAMDRDIPLVIVGTDKDLRQLVREKVVCWDTRSRVTGLAEVREEYGVDPWRLPDWFAIAGDADDGVPGVRGLGSAAAKEILQAFPSLHDALDCAASDCPWPLRDRYRTLLREQREAAELARKLVTLTAAPLPPMKLGQMVPRWPSHRNGSGSR